VIPLSWLIATGKPPANGNGNFRLTRTASFGYCRSCDVIGRKPFRPVTNFKSPPGKAGFRVSGSKLLLGGVPPPFD
jgi:hypothetical protein